MTPHNILSLQQTHKTIVLKIQNAGIDAVKKCSTDWSPKQAYFAVQMMIL